MMIDDPLGYFQEELLTVKELSRRIHYAPQTIHNLVSQGVFKLGEHYVKPRRRVLFIWSKIVEWLKGESATVDIPLTRGP